MKVQLRVKSTSCMEWEVADEAKAYYIAKDPAGFLRVLPKADYEPVEEWVDVTGMYTGLTVQVPGCEHNRYELDLRSDGYRLLERKVKR